MSYKHYQNFILQYKDVISQEIGMLNEFGEIIACSNISRIGLNVSSFELINSSKNNFIQIEEYIYNIKYTRGKIETIVFIKNTDEDSKKLLSVLAVGANLVSKYYKEKFDEVNFIKNIILENILPGDILLKARELNIKNNVPRAIFIVKCEGGKGVSLYDALNKISKDNEKDYIVSIEEDMLVYVKELSESDDNLNLFATKILKSLETSLKHKLTISIGSIKNRIKEMGASYKEAQLALHIGGIFNSSSKILNYNSLGIVRLIYQMPTTLCKLFLKEIFKDNYDELLDEEMTVSVEKFFENNLNVSETARKLFIHRNTLVYRLDKIMRLTGLDLRMFEDAVTFKVATLVKKYMDNPDSAFY